MIINGYIDNVLRLFNAVRVCHISYVLLYSIRFNDIFLSLTTEEKEKINNILGEELDNYDNIFEKNCLSITFTQKDIDYCLIIINEIILKYYKGWINKNVDLNYLYEKYDWWDNDEEDVLFLYFLLEHVFDYKECGEYAGSLIEEIVDEEYLIYGYEPEPVNCDELINRLKDNL